MLATMGAFGVKFSQDIQKPLAVDKSDDIVTK